MDNGHTQSTNPSDATQFFTTGQGNNSENLNNVNPENNLDTENWNTSIPRDPRSVGGATMATMGASESIQTPNINGMYEPMPPEYSPVDLPPPAAPNRLPDMPNRPNTPEVPNAVPGMGEIVSLDMPPGTPQDENVSKEPEGGNTALTEPDGFNPTLFHPQGEKISHETFKAAESMISALKKGELEPAPFKKRYAEACQAYQGNDEEGGTK